MKDFKRIGVDETVWTQEMGGVMGRKDTEESPKDAPGKNDAYTRSDETQHETKRVARMPRSRNPKQESQDNDSTGGPDKIGPQGPSQIAVIPIEKQDQEQETKSGQPIANPKKRVGCLPPNFKILER